MIWIDVELIVLQGYRLVRTSQIGSDHGDDEGSELEYAVSSAYHTPPVEAVEQRPQDVVFFRPSSRVEGEHPQEEEIRDGESPYPGLLSEQPLWNNVGGWEANKDLPIYDESRDLMEVVEEEEHKLRKEEVRRRFIKGAGYRKARRSKPYSPQGRMSCCGGGGKADDSPTIEDEEVDCFRDLAPNRELRRNIRRARGSIRDRTLIGDVGLGGQIAIEPLSRFCQDKLEAFRRGSGSSSVDERSSEVQDDCGGEKPLIVFA